MSEQGGGLSDGDCSLDLIESVNAALSAKFKCFKNSALSAEFLRRCRKNMDKSL